MDGNAVGWDQGMMFGFAPMKLQNTCSTIAMAHRLSRRLSEVRK